MSGAVRALLGDGRWHFQHGPIDCIVFAEGDAAVVRACLERAWARFAGILDELVGELPLLRLDLSSPAGRCIEARGPVAQRMMAACRPHARGRFLTAMAAVAGSVAEELIACFDDRRIRRAYVNNGGDIALHLTGDASFAIGLFTDPASGLAGRPLDGGFCIDAASHVRGVATSGWRGRSFSLGIADSVTVLASSAAAADAAATVIANAVDADAPGIVRRPANDVREGSDLGQRLATVAVPRLPQAAIERALAAGFAMAQAELRAGRIIGAVLSLQGIFRTVEAAQPPLSRPPLPVHRAHPLTPALAPC